MRQGRTPRLISRWISLLVFISGCAETDLGPAQPDIRVCRSLADSECALPIHLGALSQGDNHAVSLLVRNVGGGDLEVDKVELIEGSGVTVGTVPKLIPARGNAGLPLAVSPAPGPNRATLAFHSNDPDTPILEVELIFEGVASVLVFCPTEGLNATPDSCSADLTVRVTDFRVNRHQDLTVIVRNTGPHDLTLGEPRIEDNSSVAGEIEPVTPTTSAGLPAGMDSPMVIRYRAVDELADSLRLTLSSTDQVPVIQAVLRVQTGATDNQPPVAVVNEAQTGAELASGKTGLGLWLNGADSYDPEGDPLTYSWSITQAPEGSEALVDTPAASLTRLAPDFIGDYVVTLTVEDSWGATDSVEFPVRGEPHHELWVSMAWGNQAGDVDLHLVPEGESLFGDKDCHFGRTEVNWGSPGSTDDDPWLAADDVAGTGTERISIARPADGRYEVYAHYFEPVSLVPATVDISVSVDDGTLELGHAVRDLADACETWRVGVIDWPSRVFTPAGMSTTSLCYPGGGQ